MRLSLIVAMAKNRVIGKENKMPWHLPADFAYYKKTTTGHPVIMGRKTFESIGRPLPARRNIVISRNANFGANGIEVVSSLDAAIKACANRNTHEEAFVIGGASLYSEALARADRIFMTEVDATPEGDTFFPLLNMKQWRELSRCRYPADEKNAYAMQFAVLERTAP